MGECGIVIIGRNEGERLRVCLRSVSRAGGRVVYADSGSTDGSVEAARAAGVEVVEVKPPFTAARGRNAGLARLLQLAPGVEFVQFIDGDVELAPQWLEMARCTLEHRSDVAVVCGRLRERYADRSIYNRLCDAEWDRPSGETTACGGIAMMRVAPLRSAGGFREDLIAGEEPELCLRLGRAGWKVLRTSDDMGWHDAAMERFGQWWRRSVRAGHGFAQGAWVHRRGPERYRWRELMSIGLWGAALPAAAIVAAAWTTGLSLVLLAAYPIQMARIVQQEHRRGRSRGESLLVAGFMLLGKFAQAQGVLRFAGDLARGRASRALEHKTAAAAPRREVVDVQIPVGR